MALKAFKLNEQIFVALCLCTAPANFSRLKYALSAFVGLIIFSILTVGFVSSVWFIFKFYDNDVEGSFQAVYQAAALLSAICSMFSIFVKRDNLRIVLNNFKLFLDLSTSN